MNEQDRKALDGLKYHDFTEAAKAVAIVLSERSTHSPESIIKAMAYTVDLRVLINAIRSAEAKGITVEAELANAHARKQQEERGCIVVYDQFKDWFHFKCGYSMRGLGGASLRNFCPSCGGKVKRGKEGEG